MSDAVVLDYYGEPVVILDGEIYDEEPPEEMFDWDRWEYRKCKAYWNSQECRWDWDWADEETYPDDRKAMGMSWWDCNDPREFR